MRNFQRTGLEVNSAILGIRVGRDGAIEAFLSECTDEKMIHFVSNATDKDLLIMWNDTFISAVRDNPELKERFEQIDAAIQETVDLEDKKELWQRYAKRIFE